MANIKEIIASQRQYFHSGKTLPVSFRLAQLNKLEQYIKNHQQEVFDALYSDLHKSQTEATLTELNVFYDEVKYLKKHLHRLTKRKYVYTQLRLAFGKSYIVAEPYGVCLIMSPWNYPFLLTMQPLVGAIAAGNTAIIKPSAYSSHTSALIKNIISECFNPEYCCVIEGGREENTELLDQKFDFIMFTGSVNVGKLVGQKAGQTLTPMTLELGGKSPVIIDETADLEVAAKRLVFGKMINAGQTCISPDYIIVHKTKEKELIDKLIKWIKISYPTSPDGSITDYPSIINEKHFNRLMKLLEGQEIIYGGKSDKDKLFIEPTLLKPSSLQADIMTNEIFGPIFPIISYENIDEVIAKQKEKEKPLALYLFSNNKKLWKRIENELPFGSGCINDCLIHISNHNLPFGGVGNSGIGRYHGKASFANFSNYKSILNKKNYPDIKMRYRPYNEKAKKLLTKI